MNTWIRRATLIGLCSLLAICAQGQILFQNQFDGPGGELNPPAFKNVTAGNLFSNSVWSVTAGNVDWVGHTYGWEAPPSGSQNVVDLNGFSCGVGQSCANSPVGTIVSQVALSSGNGGFTAGTTYLLTFYFAGNPEYMQSTYGLNSTQQSAIAANQIVTAGFADNANGTGVIASQSFTFTGAAGQTATGSTMNWQTAQFYYTAAATTSTIYVFFSGSAGSLSNDLLSWGVVVANPVVAEMGVPEPGTYMMLGAGLLALAALRRRK